MKKYFPLLILAIVIISTSCKKKKTTDTTTSDPTPACQPTTVVVNTDVTTPTTWDACHVYLISVNQISVTSTLTIEPGTVIKFRETVTDNAILVSNSGKIIAEGTSSKPIVFTSYKDDTNGGDTNGDQTATSPARFDWGGIILNSNTCSFKYCKFLYSGKGPSGVAGNQPTLEFSSYYGVIDHCTFAYCGGDTTYNGYGVVDANGCRNNSFSITNCTFYGCIKPLFINPCINIDNSNTFHNPSNLSETNRLNGIFVTSDPNEAPTDVTWLETEVPFVLTGGLAVGDGLKLILTDNVIIKVSDLPSIGYNRIDIKDGISFIQGYNNNGVIFTSYHDDAHGGDTDGNGSAMSPTASDWYGVLDVSATIPTTNHCYTWSNIFYAQYH